jgi:S-adenosylmethionine decarboxylase proenzyme
MHNILGQHWLVELQGCAPDLLGQVAPIEAVMLEAARKAQATIVTSNFHQFAPQGVSGVVIIQESHLTIHTWPELGYAAVDLFTCGATIDADAAIAYLQNALGAQHVSTQYIERGISPSGSAQ